MRLRTRLLAALAPAMLLLFLALFALAFNTSRNILEEQIRRESRALAQAHAGEFDLLFRTGQTVAQDLALAVADDPELDSARIEQRIRAMLDQHRFVYGSTVALVPEATELGRFAPYLYRAPEGIRSTSLAKPEYDYPGWDWFVTPLERNRGTWGEPYFDEGGGNILMVTYSAPIRRGDKTLGVATVDISIEELVDQIRALRVADSGYAFLITANGRLIAHPRHQLLSEQDLATMVKTSGNENLNALKDLATEGGEDFAALTDPFLNQPSWVVSSRIEATGTTLLIVLPLREIMRPVTRLKQKMLLAAALIMGLTLLIVLALAANITRPLTRLVDQAEYFAAGHLDRRLSQDSGPLEARHLAQAFNRMGAALKKHIEEVRNATAEKERYHKELQIAAEIQQGILPHRFPPFPDLEARLDLWGLTRPAREVGGDYYDFFRLSHDRIGIVVADVSDKGAAAALFMAITHTLVREVARRRVPPAEVLRRINRTLADENPSSMFVTLVYAEYHSDTGRLRLVNAGHNPPLIRRVDGDVQTVTGRARLPLGAMPDTRYETLELALEPGDGILLYSDGVTEACNPEREEWGLGRLREVLGELTGDMRTIDRELLAQVDAFRRSAEQHDDITLLLLQRRLASSQAAGEPTRSRSVRMEWSARTEILEKVAGFAETMAREAGFDAREAGRLVLAVDEVVSNLIRHGGSDENRFAMELTPLGGGLEITVIDWGEPFDFEAKSRQYSGTASLEQKPGGIGLYLARQSVDELRYVPGAEDGNRLTLVKYLSASR
jgi:sigma-B regulation protein RsbU (phosphoserine phosphatase)